MGVCIHGLHCYPCWLGSKKLISSSLSARIWPADCHSAANGLRIMPASLFVFFVEQDNCEINFTEVQLSSHYSLTCNKRHIFDKSWSKNRFMQKLEWAVSSPLLYFCWCQAQKLSYLKVVLPWIVKYHFLGRLTSPDTCMVLVQIFKWYRQSSSDIVFHFYDIAWRSTAILSRCFSSLCVFSQFLESDQMSALRRYLSK